MEWDLWDAVSYTAPQENDSDIQGLQCDFGYGYGPDPIREDELNSESVMQVLEIWMKKADKDLLELEEDLLKLNSELCMSDKEWSKYSTLKEKIKQLEFSIEKLKNGSIHDNENLEIPREPAESLCDILNALLANYSQQKADEQSLQIVAYTSSSEQLADAAEKQDAADSDFEPETAIVEYFSPSPRNLDEYSTLIPYFGVEGGPVNSESFEPETSIVEYFSSSPRNLDECSTLIPFFGVEGGPVTSESFEPETAIVKYSSPSPTSATQSKKRRSTKSRKKEVKGLELPLCPVVVDCLSLAELRAIGKQQKLKRYYCLTKAELARQLGLDTYAGKSKNKRRCTTLMIQDSPGEV